MAVIRPVLTLLATLLMASCACDGWQDPQGVQLPLFGDQRCSDPVFGQAAMQCCTGWTDSRGFHHIGHDNCYAAGGTEADRFACDAEFLACMAVAGVPESIAEARYKAVRRYGEDAFRYQEHRTRGFNRTQ